MMADADGHDHSKGETEASPKGGLWKRIWGFDSWVHSAASLSIVTLIAGWFGTYIQYLNSYEQKVTETAQADMTTATTTFLDVSNAYAEAQTQQQLIYYSFLDASKDKAGAGDKEMATNAAKTAYPDYVKSRNALRRDSNSYYRKAELYIDWASDLQRDPADTKAIDYDPLVASSLGVYDFDCDAPANFPHYAYNKDGKADVAADDDKTEHGMCEDPNQNEKQISYKSHTVLCIYDKKKKAVDHQKPALIINWHSAKHHLMVMQYCFEGAHTEFATVRTWASGNDITDQERKDFLADPNRHQDSLNHEVERLDAFMSLAMSQIERIRVKYRPSSFYCSLPLIGDVMGDRCNPIRIAKSKS